MKKSFVATLKRTQGNSEACRLAELIEKLAG